MTLNLALFGLQLFLLLSMAAYTQRLWENLRRSPRLNLISRSASEVSVPSNTFAQPEAAESGARISPATLAIVIPAYNEADNIRACVQAALQACPPSFKAESARDQAPAVQIWVVDDQSSDRTLAIAQALQQELDDPRLQVLLAPPRPAGETWVGKNWACTQAVERCGGEFILFIDADVRLKPGAIATALAQVQRENIDLLTLGPEIQCGCFSEWLVQPLIMGMFMCGFPPHQVNDPNQETSFAVGPFMLFRRSAYEAIGGHRGVAAEVVEDVQLSRRIKRAGLRIYYALAPDLASVRMYQTGAQLWEGWTKNWYLGSERNLPFTLGVALLALCLGAGPYVLGAVALGHLLGAVGSPTPLWPVLLPTLTLIASGLHLGIFYLFRRGTRQIGAMPTHLWWLMGLGGVGLAAIALGSVIKTETGWGWTWRGRSLKN